MRIFAVTLVSRSIRNVPYTESEVQDMTTAQFIRVFGACCVLGMTSTVCQANQADDEAAIRKSDVAYVEAYNKQDAKALAALWSPEAVYVDPETETEIVGREAIEKEFADTFSSQKNAKLEIKADAIKFMSPNVAVESGLARITRPDAEPDESNYSALYVKHDGTWFLDRVTEEETPLAPVAPPSNYEHLKDLEWMVGSWIDQDDTDHVMIQTDCNWTKNKNFITRSFAVVVGDKVDMSGIQLIGWDPVAKQIRSWVFDSDGGFGEGKWSKKGKGWVVQQTGTLPDGRKAAEVNVIKPVDNDSFTWQTIQRSVDGDILPDVEEITIVRKPAD
jgi:uncharacterized protein (TIGR02246 family)